jgi:hypothetical protein
MGFWGWDGKWVLSFHGGFQRFEDPIAVQPDCVRGFMEEEE